MLKAAEGGQKQVQPLDLLDLAEKEKDGLVLRNAEGLPSLGLGDGGGEVQKMAVGDQGELLLIFREEGGKAGHIGLGLDVDPIAETVNEAVEKRVEALLVHGQDVVHPGHGMDALFPELPDIIGVRGGEVEPLEVDDVKALPHRFFVHKAPGAQVVEGLSELPDVLSGGAEAPRHRAAAIRGVRLGVDDHLHLGSGVLEGVGQAEAVFVIDGRDLVQHKHLHENEVFPFSPARKEWTPLRRPANVYSPLRQRTRHWAVQNR